MPLCVQDIEIGIRIRNKKYEIGHWTFEKTFEKSFEKLSEKLFEKLSEKSLANSFKKSW